MTRPKPPSGGRRSHTSPKANLGRETKSRLARCWELACLGKLIQRGSGKCVCKV
jgi:hypothetical protein